MSWKLEFRRIASAKSPRSQQSGSRGSAGSRAGGSWLIEDPLLMTTSLPGGLGNFTYKTFESASMVSVRLPYYYLIVVVFVFTNKNLLREPCYEPTC